LRSRTLSPERAASSTSTSNHHVDRGQLFGDEPSARALDLRDVVRLVAFVIVWEEHAKDALGDADHTILERDLDHAGLKNPGVLEEEDNDD
jgi:hypothetical protein